jgi:hypothetical protein
MDDLPERVAVLEQIARETVAGLADIRTELRQMRTEARSDFRWILGIVLAGNAGLLGVMAHGFHWL